MELLVITLEAHLISLLLPRQRGWMMGRDLASQI